MKPRSNMTRIAIAIIACCPLGLAVNNASAGEEKAIAYLEGCTDPNISGEVKLKQKINNSRAFRNQGVVEVEVEVKIEGLGKSDEETEHGVHIHETAACHPTCGAAGGHFDPGPFGFTNPDGNHPYHSGDLPNITVKKDGKGKVKSKTSRVTLTDGPLTVFDDDGSAIIVHVNEDTFCPEGAEGGCAGGARLACGIIERD